MKNFLLLAISITLLFNSDAQFKILSYGVVSDGGKINISRLFTAGNTDEPCMVMASTSDKFSTTNLNVVPFRTYSTNFSLTESTISEGGNWINGSTTGLDWGYVSTTAGQTHTHPGTASYADATALLTGAWGSNQMAQATVGSIVNACTSDNCYPEVELRLRSTLSAHLCNGYEITFSLKPNDRAYLIIVRWNGPLGNFTYLFNQSGSQYLAKTGDVVKAIIVGNVISAYKNGVLMGQATDNTFTSGNPGMGFNEQSYNGDYGFSSFTASDNPSNLE
jgi:hypothetical protein